MALRLFKDKTAKLGTRALPGAPVRARSQARKRKLEEEQFLEEVVERIQRKVI